MEKENASTEPKFIFVTGGPMSGIGKGIIASSIAMMFGWSEVPATAIKIDGYLNYDADTMSPFEHGEAYVTADGGVSDLDLGNYERFVGLELTRDNSITMGKIYAAVAARERAGDYGGKTVQIVPHITNEIKSWIRRVASKPVSINGVMTQPKVCIVEIGGTVGDMETQPVFHAIKQMIYEESRDHQKHNMCFIHVSHLSYVGSSDGDREEKTKPTQHNVELLRSMGISPDIMIVRCEKSLSTETREKLAAQCLVYNIIDSYNVPNIHHVPKVLHQQRLIQIIRAKFNMDAVMPDPIMPDNYKQLISYFDSASSAFSLPFLIPNVDLGVIGKYTGMNDTYLSLTRAIQHAAFANNVIVNIHWVDADKLCEDAWNNTVDHSKNRTQENEENKELAYAEMLEKFDGILVPGGFGSRGIGGMFYAARYARKTDTPYFGICLGMQILVSEFAQSINIDKYDICYKSEEWCSPNCSRKKKHHVVHILPKLINDKASGQTMRLGNHPCTVELDTITHKAYGTSEIVERHRHRYEVNEKAVGYLEDEGLIFSGVNKNDRQNLFCEIAELRGKKFHVGCQFHPEFQSRHWKPHPLFNAFIAAIAKDKKYY